MNLLTNEQMKKLNTKRLLAYKNALMKVPETDNWDGEGFSKSSLEWKNTYARVKAVLATREHVK